MDDGLRGNFIIEATELLDEAEEALLDYDNGLDFSTCYNKVFRAFHSLKGASGMFGIDLLQEHLHKLETLLSGIEETFPDGAVDYFLSGIDSSRSYFETNTIEFKYIDSFDQKNDVKQAGSSVKAKIESNTKSNSTQKEGKKIKGYVYVVDDEQLIVDLIEEILTSANIKVRTFMDGEEVLRAVVDDTPDLILSDIKMPKVDGLTMLKKIDSLGINIPIIFISGFVTRDAVLAGLDSGAHYFLEKPFDDKVVLSLTDSVLKNVKARSILERSLDYVMYQFANQEKILIEVGKEKEVQLIKDEIKNLVALAQDLYP